MVRGLVQEQKVVVLLHHDGQRQPPLLAAGQTGDPGEHLVASESEEGEIGPHRFLGLAGMLVPDRVDRALGGIEIGQELVVVADRNLVPRRRRPPERGQAPGKGLQERRLSGAVLAQDGQALPAQQLEGHAAHDRLPGLVSRIEVLRAQEDAATDLGGLELEGDLGRVLRRLLEDLHAGELRPPALGLPRVLPGDVAADVLLLLLDELLLFVESARGREDALGLLAAVCGIAPE